MTFLVEHARIGEVRLAGWHPKEEMSRPLTFDYVGDDARVSLNMSFTLAEAKELKTFIDALINTHTMAPTMELVEAIFPDD